MATSPEEANQSYNDFKALQQEWKEIKTVPADKANELWRNYQLYVEQFYDLLKLNSEAREYDFKKTSRLRPHSAKLLKSSTRSRMSSLPSTSCRTCTSSTAKSVLLPRNCASRSGAVSRRQAP